MTELTQKIVAELLNDEAFVKDFSTSTQNILKDKTFDASDLPEVMNLVIILTEKKDNFKIRKEDIADVFNLLILELLKKLDVDVNDPILKKMIESCLNLLKTKVTTVNWKDKFKKLFSCKC